MELIVDRVDRYILCTGLARIDIHPEFEWELLSEKNGCNLGILR
jgi:hypothetical protein